MKHRWLWALMAVAVLVGIFLYSGRWPSPSTGSGVSGTPAGEPGSIPEVTPAELKERKEKRPGLLLVFVGPRMFFEDRHITGAACVPYEELESFFRPVDRDREIVLYCGCCAGWSEGVSGSAVRRLMAMGFRNIAHLRGHFAAWEAYGYATGGRRAGVTVEHAYANPEQKEKLDAFAAEALRRRGELEAAIRAERDGRLRGEMERRLAHLDRDMEIEGLRLKRRLAEEAGDLDKVRDIDRIIQEKTRAK